MSDSGNPENIALLDEAGPSSNNISPDNNAAEANGTPTASQLQQSIFDNMPDYDWLKYDRDQSSYLKQNIAYALFSAPRLEGDLSADDLQGYSSREKERVTKIYDKIVEQGKYNRQGNIFMHVIQVVYVKPETYQFIENEEYWSNLENRTDVVLTCTPVFKIRKCAQRITSEGSCCKLYIDEDARVYQSWDGYLQNNNLPESMMVVPTDGEYTGVIEGEDVVVSLSVSRSPSLSVGGRLLRAADTGATAVAVVGLGAGGAAAALPLAAAAGTVAAVAGTASAFAGVYGFVRSTFHLADRNAHEQSINPIVEADARGSWLNVVMSSVGLSASACGAMLARSATAGNNLTQAGRFLTTATDVLGKATLVTGFGGVANGAYTMYEKYMNHGESPTKLELFQFTSSLLFFAGTAMSNRTAQNIIEESQTNAINDYRTTLRSNRHRKIFDKVSAETRRVGGHAEGNTEVIRAIRTIDNRDQFWAHVLKVNNDAKTHGVRVSVTSDGSINLNAQQTFKPGTLYGMESGHRANLFASMGSADKTVPNVSTKLQFNNTSNNYITAIIFDGDSVLSNINPNQVIRLGQFVYTVSQTSFENIESVLSRMSAEVHNTFLALCARLIEQLSRTELEIVQELFNTEHILGRIVEYVYGYLRDMAQQYVDTVDDNPFLQALQEFFVDGRIRESTCRMLRDIFVSWARGELRLVQEDNARRVECEVCNGFRYA